MYIIGIDFSILYPTACITKDFKKFRWISCINTKLTKVYRKFLEDIQLEYQNLEFIFLPERQGKQLTYSATERAKLENHSLLTDTFVNRINEIVLEDTSEHHVIVSIEGMAYGAQGNALVDIAQSTGMLRKNILDTTLGGKSKSLFVFSPGELKNAIGAKGNAGKYDIFTQFKDSPLLAKDSDLYRCILQNEEQILKDLTVKSPFSDMIDSYLAILKIHESLKESL